MKEKFLVRFINRNFVPTSTLAISTTMLFACLRKGNNLHLLSLDTKSKNWLLQLQLSSYLRLCRIHHHVFCLFKESNTFHRLRYQKIDLEPDFSASGGIFFIRYLNHNFVPTSTLAVSTTTTVLFACSRRAMIVSFAH